MAVVFNTFHTAISLPNTLKYQKYLGASPLWPCTVRVPCSSWNDVINFTVVFLLDCLWRFCNLGPSLRCLADTGSRVQHRGPFKNSKFRIYGSGRAQAGLVLEPQKTRAGDINLTLWGELAQLYKKMLCPFKAEHAYILIFTCCFFPLSFSLFVRHSHHLFWIHCESKSQSLNLWLIASSSIHNRYVLRHKVILDCSSEILSIN